jgi:signal transduction histidine kinase
MDAEITLLDRLVGDLLDMARFDAGEADLRLERVPLAAMGRGRVLPQPASHRGARRVRVDDTAGDRPRGGMDPQRLLQALSNLVDNAVNATRERESPTIELNALRLPGILVAYGGGQWPRYSRGRPALGFRPLLPRGAASRAAYGGAGLGLSIARSIVTAMGGVMAIDSTPDQTRESSMTFSRFDPTHS